jgi:DNA-binding protein Fis
MEKSQPNHHKTVAKTVQDVDMVQVNVQHLIQQNEGRAYRALQNQVESAFFAALMATTQGNKTQAARIAGLDTGTLNRYLARYTISITKRVLVGGQK